MREPSEVAEQQPEAQESAERREEPKVEFSEEQQKIVDSQIAGKAFEVREEKRQKAELQRQLDEVKANIPKEARPDVPNAGDIYDEDYETNRAAREAKLVEQARFDERQTVQGEQVQQAQHADLQRQQEAFNQQVSEFGNRATKAGINPQELQTAMNTVNQYGIRQDIGNFVIADEQGHLITKYLAENPQDIDTVNKLDGMNAGIFMNTVREKAVALYTKRTSDAPDPPDNLTGSGVPPRKRGAAGATFK